MNLRTFPASTTPPEAVEQDTPGVLAFIAWLNGGELPADHIAFARTMVLDMERYRSTLEQQLARASTELGRTAYAKVADMELPTGPGAEWADGYEAGVCNGCAEAAKLIQQAISEAGAT